MDTFIAVCCFVLSLFGWEPGGTTLIHRASADGSDVLYSRTWVQPGVARFECVRSRSGQCHYAVYPRGCGPARQETAGACGAQSARRFVVARGDSRRIAGLDGFSLCVSADGAVHGAGCDAVDPHGSRWFRRQEKTAAPS